MKRIVLAAAVLALSLGGLSVSRGGDVKPVARLQLYSTYGASGSDFFFKSDRPQDRRPENVGGNGQTFCYTSLRVVHQNGEPILITYVYNPATKQLEKAYINWKYIVAVSLNPDESKDIKLFGDE